MITDTTAFLDRRFAGQHGYLCIGYIDGDPSIKKGKPGYAKLKQEFYAWPKQRSVALDRLAFLAAETAGNTYAAVCLFATKKRSYAGAVPSPWLWADDVNPDAFDWSETIETSAGNYQGWIQLDQAVTAEARRDLVKRLRLHLGASDACSSDAIHMGRCVGGFNTKGHAHFPVAVDTMDGTIWSLAELDALLPPLPMPTAQTADSTIVLDDAFWRHVAHHYHNVDALLASGRIEIIKPETQAGRILGDDLSHFCTPKGDEDRSMNAYVLAYGLHLRGFPSDEIAAIVLHKYTVWGTVRDKGSAWAYRDIAERIIPKITTDRPDIRTSPTHYRAMGTSHSLPAIPASHARKDRAQRLDAPGLFVWYRQQGGESGVVMQTRTEIAGSLHISVPTLDRLDAILRSQGLIERRTERAGGANYSYVIICDMAQQDAVHDDDSTPLTVAVEKTAEGVLSPSFVDMPPIASQSHAPITTTVPIRSNTLLSLTSAFADSPSVSALADATAWLRTLRPWQLEKMMSFAAADELLTWLELRTPDEIEASAVVIALQRVSLEPAPVAEPQLTAAQPAQGGASVTPITQPLGPTREMVANQRRRRPCVEMLNEVDCAALSAVHEGRDPGYSQLSVEQEAAHVAA